MQDRERVKRDVYGTALVNQTVGEESIQPPSYCPLYSFSLVLDGKCRRHLSYFFGGTEMEVVGRVPGCSVVCATCRYRSSVTGRTSISLKRLTLVGLETQAESTFLEWSLCTHLSWAILNSFTLIRIYCLCGFYPSALLEPLYYIARPPSS